MKPIESIETDILASIDVPAKKSTFLLAIPRLSENVQKRLSSNIQTLRNRKIADGLYLATDQHTSQLAAIGIPYLTFKRAKDIVPLRDAKTDLVAHLRYALVTYKFLKPDSAVKKKVQRIIRRSAAIRVRPGVVLFPHFRAKENRKLVQETVGTFLLNSKKFANEMKFLGAEVHRWTRLELVRLEDQILIRDAIEWMVDSELGKLEKKILDLRTATEQPEITLRRLRERLSELKGIYQEYKIRYAALQLIWDIDTAKQLRRIYNMLLSVRKKIQVLRTSESILVRKQV